MWGIKNLSRKGTRRFEGWGWVKASRQLKLALSFDARFIGFRKNVEPFKGLERKANRIDTEINSSKSKERYSERNRK